MSYKWTILKAIQGTTKEGPATLVDIVYWGDATERIILTYDEVTEGLKELIEEGKVAEAEAGRYYSPAKGEARDKGFTQFTNDEYYGAVKKYKEDFKRRAMEIVDDEDFLRDTSFAVRWKTPAYPTDDDEEAAEEFAEKVYETLDSAGLIGGVGRDGKADMPGFEMGPDGIDILIWCYKGVEPERVQDILKKVFEREELPKGSALIKEVVKKGRDAEETVLGEK